MRTRVLLVVSITFIIISGLHPVVEADSEIIIPSESAVDLIPIVTGEISRSQTSEAPNDICISSDGTIFVVAANPIWQLIRGASSASFIAWRNDGSIRWAQRFTSWDRLLYDVETDDTHVFVTGARGTRLFVAKYTMDGNNVWNITRSMSNISYGYEMGIKLSLTDDGTIFTSGISMNYSDSTVEYFVAAFDQDGDYQWSQTFQSYPSLCCDSNFIYLINNDRLQKRDSSGTVLWEKVWSGDSPVYVQSDLLYTTQVQGYPPSTSLDVETWNLTDSMKVWSSNFRLCDMDHQVYNKTGIDIKVTQDGSMLILMGAVDVFGWYLLHVNQGGELASKVNRINMTMIYNTQLEFDTAGFVYLAGVSDTGNLTVEIYDSNHFVDISTEGFDIPLIIAGVTGVVALDIGLVLYLKKKHPS